MIDPQRDIDRVTAELDERGLRLTHVFETHVHNDYVTGGLELARLTGADYVLAAEDDVAFERTGASEGDEFAVGRLQLRAMHTPGHTPSHLSYVVVEQGAEPVKGFETSGQDFFCASPSSSPVSVWMVGLLIQAAVGSRGGLGRRFPNRAGLAA